jgi:hypothetical protein
MKSCLNGKVGGTYSYQRDLRVNIWRTADKQQPASNMGARWQYLSSRSGFFTHDDNTRSEGYICSYHCALNVTGARGIAVG